MPYRSPVLRARQRGRIGQDRFSALLAQATKLRITDRLGRVVKRGSNPGQGGLLRLTNKFGRHTYIRFESRAPSQSERLAIWSVGERRVRDRHIRVNRRTWLANDLKQANVNRIIRRSKVFTVDLTAHRGRKQEPVTMLNIAVGTNAEYAIASALRRELQFRGQSPSKKPYRFPRQSRLRYLRHLMLDIRY